MKNISPARIAAFEILLKIEKERAFSSALLPRYEENLDQKDRALCHELTMGVLRRKYSLDKMVEFWTKKKTEKFDLEVLVPLRLGLYQILFLDRIPAYSAINESVNLTLRAKKRSASGLVNAVLRNASREKIPELSFADEIERVSVETSHPRWLIKNWEAQFGLADTEAIACANNKTPRSAFRFTARFFSKGLPQRKAIIGLIEQSDVRPSEFIDDCFIVEKSNEIFRNLAESGDIYFQDEGSQMVGNCVNLKENERFLDICAAPGSKTTYVFWKLQGAFQGLFIAGDLYDHRMRNLVQNCRNQGADEVQFVRYDAETCLPFSERSFDAVLLDAPCSGTGTIRSNPEIRYFLSKKDLVELPAKQLMFLRNASKLVKRGGRLIYSTCSIETQENEEVIERFLESDSEFEVTNSKLSEKFQAAGGFSRTFPNRDGVDGFFVAILIRR